jgi:hypothetical protein
VRDGNNDGVVDAAFFEDAEGSGGTGCTASPPQLVVTYTP